MCTKLDRLTERAKEEPKRQFFSIAHLITPEALQAAFRSLRKEASAGWTGSRIRSTKRTPRERSKSLIRGSKTDSTKPNRCAGSTYRRRTEAETDLDSRAGGQDRAESEGGSTEHHVSAGFSRVLLRVRTRKRTAPGTGRSEASHLHPLQGM